MRVLTSCAAELLMLLLLLPATDGESDVNVVPFLAPAAASSLRFERDTLERDPAPASTCAGLGRPWHPFSRHAELHSQFVFTHCPHTHSSQRKDPSLLVPPRTMPFLCGRSWRGERRVILPSSEKMARRICWQAPCCCRDRDGDDNGEVAQWSIHPWTKPLTATHYV